MPQAIVSSKSDNKIELSMRFHIFYTVSAESIACSLFRTEIPFGGDQLSENDFFNLKLESGGVDGQLHWGPGRAAHGLGFLLVKS